MLIYTIGFAEKSLREFVGLVQSAGIKKVVDIRLNNTSQLAGYSKKDDLAFVLELLGIAYEHVPDLAPTKELMEGYKKKALSWPEYEEAFHQLLVNRHAEALVNKVVDVNPVCLLCSEAQPARCHRRLVAEFFARLIDNAEVRHL